MTALPQQSKMSVPIDWQGTTQKSNMSAAGYDLSVTIGWRPYSETATLRWTLPKADALALIETFQATNFNGVYDYTCLFRGAIKIRLTGEYSYNEVRGTQKATVTAGVKRI
ncbi:MULTISPECIES: hypothetical protein [unclassified Sphingopyxis]|uniref:hypothetical protein n=1 Tax=unclassified Sphingopyxis TaxID=2614943 RepID=UPI000A9EFD1E|nr:MULTISPECIES: hypothetical protein [unclassified Sphingopyxis]